MAVQESYLNVLPAQNLAHPDVFSDRHIGPDANEQEAMLTALGYDSFESLVADTIPADIRLEGSLNLPAALSEQELLSRATELASKNKVFRSYIGTGYYGTITPTVILRNILENPGWYTQYTPYQAEISQGRLEALLNYQTLITDLTGLPIANASLLDEGTAAAEAMGMLFNDGRRKKSTFLASTNCHPQTLAILKTRADAFSIKLEISHHADFDLTNKDVFGLIVQYPATDGAVEDYSALCEKAHDIKAKVVVAADLMSLTMLTPPAEFGADVAVGTSQQFGVPMGYGGPHAAYFATTDKFKRKLPGRIIGVSTDMDGNPALRMALQTREQHIRREKATSNICTAQVLLAVMASMYAVYHGQKGIKAIAGRIHFMTNILSAGLEKLGHKNSHSIHFDTLRITPNGDANVIIQKAVANKINLRQFDNGDLGISLDETVNASDIDDLLMVFGAEQGAVSCESLAGETETNQLGSFARSSDFLTHPVFNTYNSETEMLRYMYKLQMRDLSLTTSMIPLGSCTMKLNATSEMIPVTKPEFGAIHPFAPVDQAQGYAEMITEMEAWLAEITGFDATSLQPNSGAQGEYTGLLVIRAWHHNNGDFDRKVCIIPSSAHGTNPASAVMAGMDVVVVACDDQGNIDLVDLKEKVVANSDKLSALMVTYPSTHGVFEERIKDICDLIHEHGGLVYMDGANMNAQVGLCRPGDIGADVCHLNLHKTFSIPHGGGGPGVGPICVTKALAPFLPSHPLIKTGGEKGISPVAAAPWSSISVTLISWAYIAMMGNDGLTKASQVAILNANYMADRLKDHYPIVYSGKNGRCAHECIIDLRAFKASAGVTEEDVAKRLMDYGYHAPTMSWPVHGTMMIEPTESESRAEMDRFCDAMIAIRGEIQGIAEGTADKEDNVLINAPHTAQMVIGDDWNHAYGREKAAYPANWLRDHKFWPSVRRVNSAQGDRNLVCSCPPIEDYV